MVRAKKAKQNKDAWLDAIVYLIGGHDYRLVDGEGFAVFTALQRQSIPSRLVYFPAESHWVLNHANSLKWHHEGKAWMGTMEQNMLKIVCVLSVYIIVLGWIDRYTEHTSEQDPTYETPQFTVQHQFWFALPPFF